MTQQYHTWVYIPPKNQNTNSKRHAVFIAALFTSTDEWIKNMWYIYTITQWNTAQP